VFAATVTLTAPEPVPLDGPTVTQLALLDAAHPQVAPVAVSATLDEPDPEDRLNDVGDRLKLQGGAAAWLTV
jgi:hypothetical protein